jgi:hypothetical protein
VTISLDSTEIAAGIYTVQVWETDIYTGFVAKTSFEVEVFLPAVDDLSADDDLPEVE